MSEPKYKVGDRVRIRSLEDLIAEKGESYSPKIPKMAVGWNEVMHKECGKDFIISEVLTDGYTQPAYRLRGTSYTWSEDSFEYCPKTMKKADLKENRHILVDVKGAQYLWAFGVGNSLTGQTGVSALRDDLTNPNADFTIKEVYEIDSREDLRALLFALRMNNPTSWFEVRKPVWTRESAEKMALLESIAKLKAELARATAAVEGMK